MPSARPQPLGTLFKVLDVPYRRLKDHPGLAMDVCTGKWDVVLVRKVFSARTMNAVLRKLVAGEHGLTLSPQWTPDLSVPQVTIYGESITPNDVDKENEPEKRIDRYHKGALAFRKRCRALFAGAEDYESRIEELFRIIGHPCKSRVPADQEGRKFTPSTIRRVDPGCEMNLHVGNYFYTTPTYSYLATLFAPLDQLSFFIPLSPSDSGGALEVFELTYGDPRTPLRADGRFDAEVIEKQFRFEPFAPEKGDMFLFNGGKYYHRVDHVVGKKPRWTIGGFVAYARDPKVLYHWG